MTAAEILVSITSLEFSYTQAPKKDEGADHEPLLSLIHAGKQLHRPREQVHPEPRQNQQTGRRGLLSFFAGVMFVTALVFSFVAKNYRYETYIQDEAA